MAGSDGAGVSHLAFRRQVLALVAKWRPRLLLDAWEITVQVNRRIRARADCEAAPAYLEAVIRFNPTLIKPEDLEATVVHELLHCHTWRLWELAGRTPDDDPIPPDEAERAHELLTSTLQRVVMR